MTIDQEVRICEFDADTQHLVMKLLKDHIYENGSYSPDGHAEFNREVDRCGECYPELYPLWRYAQVMFEYLH